MSIGKVQAFDCCFEIAGREVGVDHRHGDVGMSEKLLPKRLEESKGDFRSYLHVCIRYYDRSNLRKIDSQSVSLIAKLLIRYGDEEDARHALTARIGHPMSRYPSPRLHLRTGRHPEGISLA